MSGASRMGFGKYKGQTIAWIVANDPNYARWLLAQDWLHDSLRSALDAELDGQRWDETFGKTHTATRAVVAPAVVTMAGEIIGAGFRVVARRLHPDLGGDHTSMVVANEAVAWLREIVGGQ